MLKHQGGYQFTETPWRSFSILKHHTCARAHTRTHTHTHTHTHTLCRSFSVYPQIHILFLPCCAPYHREADPCRPISAVNWLLACFSQWEAQSEDWRVGKRKKPAIFSLTLSLLQGSNCVFMAPAPVESPYPLASTRGPQFLCSDNTPDCCCPSAKG